MYAKQVSVAECGGDEPESAEWWVPAPPKGYVEPNVEFYSRMYNLIHFTEKSLTEKGFLPKKLTLVEFDSAKNNKELGELPSEPIILNFDLGFDAMKGLMKFLKTVSEKELAKISLSYEENNSIQKIGSLVENITLKLLNGDTETDVSSDENDDIRKKVPVIADVLTSQGSVLEVGVGKPHEMYVIIEIEGQLKITRGAVFSFYEFLWPSSDRLTNEKWQGMFDKSDDLPEMPIWTKPFRSDSKTMKYLKPYFTPHEYVPASSTKPGWHRIYYGTGC